MKYKFNIKPLILEARNQEEAWKKFGEEVSMKIECDDMEELEEIKTK